MWGHKFSRRVGPYAANKQPLQGVSRTDSAGRTEFGSVVSRGVSRGVSRTDGAGRPRGQHGHNR